MRLADTPSDRALLIEVGSRLAQQRVQRGWSQAELAARAGVPKRTLERLERGTSIAFVTVLRVFRALDLIDSLEALLPAPRPSPMALLELKRETRRRAPRKTRRAAASTWTWDA